MTIVIEKQVDVVLLLKTSSSTWTISFFFFILYMLYSEPALTQAYILHTVYLLLQTVILQLN